MDIFCGCKWIGADTRCESPIIIRKFSTDTPQKAILTVTSLGFFEAKLNGKLVTDDRFLPVVSDYEPRDFSAFLYPLGDKTTNRLYYYQFDVTSLLVDGENLLSIQLGNGWYRQKDRIGEGRVYFGEILKAVFRLDIITDSGSYAVCSDGSEKWKDSEIRYSNLFYGEVIDPAAVDSMEYDVVVFPPPDTFLSEAKGTPDKVVRLIRPSILSQCEGVTLYDVGENISGVVAVETSAAEGEIIVRFAERLSDDGQLDFESAGGLIIGANGKPQIQEDVFVCDGKTTCFEPKFVWHGFRYFTIRGCVDKVTVKVIHSDTPVLACFESSSEALNFLYDAFLRSQLTNMHGSIPSDCPHRERLGYTGDGQICAPAAMLTLDCKEFYEKWIQDILDCQDQKSGHVQHTAPFMGGGGGPGGWGSAIVFVPYHFYKQYGDLSMLVKCYEPMCRWIEYLESRCEGGLVTHEEEGGWCLGDWCTLEPTTIPAEYVNTCFFIKNLLILEEISISLGRSRDIERWRNIRRRLEEAVVDRYYDQLNCTYAGGIQGADAFAVWCGLAGEDAARRIANKYSELGHFDTGFLGTDILLEVLFQYGYGKTAMKLLESEAPGSYLYMKRHGATTLWESWRGEGSHNHPMFGAPVRHLFTEILGIRQRSGTAGYADVVIEPCVTELEYVSGSITVPNGTVSVRIDNREGKSKLSVDATGNVCVEIRKGEYQYG